MPEKIKLPERIFEFKFSSEVISISKDELIRSLSYSADNLPDTIEASINKTMELIRAHYFPVGGFLILPKDKIRIEPDCFYIDDICINSNNIISRYFRNVETFAILVATIGNDLEILSGKLLNEGDSLNGFIVDVAASALVEKTMDIVENKLADKISSSKLGVTNRYSPGYCGWDVNDQHKLFSFLPAIFCGISLNDSAMMFPVKSVSAIVGIGKDAKREEYACEICDIDFCYKKDTRKFI